MNSNERTICNQVGLPSSVIDTHGIDVSILNFQKNSILFSPGESCQAFLILCEGSIRVDMTAKSGRDVTLYRMNPSESCILTTSALINNEHYYAQGIAESDITAITLSTQGFYNAIQHSKLFARYILEGYAGRVSSIIKLVDRMATRDVMYDVCRYITKIAKRDSVVHITQAKLASEIGTAREVVGRKLQMLEVEGIISLNRGAITVLNFEELNKRALQTT